MKNNSLGRIYISGPISGLKFSIVERAFADAAADFDARGWLPVNPLHNGLPMTAAWEQRLAADIVELIKCRAIYMLRGWKDSHGARLEHALAERMGLIIYYQEKQ